MAGWTTIAVMSTSTGETTQSGTVQVRYWASAKEAAGTAEESVTLEGAASVDAVVEELVRRRSGADAERLAKVLGVCSVLVGDRPTKDRATEVAPGGTLEFLPPFAGG